MDTTQDAAITTYSPVPPGKAELFVVGRDGFIEGSFLCYVAKNNSDDYHDKMNSEHCKLFLRWLTTQLLPSLPQPSVLVLYNALCHSQPTGGSVPHHGKKKKKRPSGGWSNARYSSHLSPHNLSRYSSASRTDSIRGNNTIRKLGQDVVRLEPVHPAGNPTP